ncbi:MAG TPA: hypothetical protein ENJ32_07320 [Crenotrichaceae bacterium]|nr:hypothetical protein [Crenotrichaceae bacterium]
MKTFGYRALAMAVLVTAISSSVAGLSDGQPMGFNPEQNLNQLVVNELSTLSDPELEKLRGGFFDGNTLKLTFGFESIVMIDGVLQTKTSLNIPTFEIDFANRTSTFQGGTGTVTTANQLAAGASITTAGTRVTGASLAPGEVAASGYSIRSISDVVALMKSPTFVQNNVDNRTIQTFVTTSIKLEGVDLKGTNGVQSLVTPGLLDSLH